MSEDGQLTSYAELVEILEALPLLVRERRRSLRLSMRTAAEQVGTDNSSVHRLESGNGHTSLPNAIKFLRWLDSP